METRRHGEHGGEELVCLNGGGLWGGGVAIMSGVIGRIQLVCLVVLGWLGIALSVRAEQLPIVEKVAAQPLVAQVRQVEEALEYLGSPLPDGVKAKLDEAFRAEDEAARV